LNPALAPRALVLVAAGGAVGGLGRYGLTRAFPVGSGTFPTTTFLVNMGGAFVLAVLLETLARRGASDHWSRLVVGVGVLGAFTTFSTLAAEIALLWRDHHRGLAVGYGAATVGAGVAAVFAGLWAAGRRRGPAPADAEA
jgi:CrcB protein